MRWRTSVHARFHIRLLLAAAITLLSTTVAAAGTLTLTWDPNPEPDIAGYVVFYGTVSGQYSSNFDVGNQTWFSFEHSDPSKSYYFAVSAYNTSGVRSDLSAEVSTSDSGLPLALTGTTSSLPAPQSVGTSISFAAATGGGVAPVQFKWLVFNGSKWNVAQAWSASNTFTWTPTSANAHYRVGVWARSATSTADAPDSSSATDDVPFPISGALALTSLSANMTAPQPVGTTVTFKAAASGGAAPYQFKWLQWDGATWRVAQEWSGSDSYSWTPTVANANYAVGVWVRSATNTVDGPESTSAAGSMPFAITASGVSITSVIANKAAPQSVGSKIQFTASASGASWVLYKWWVSNGSTWTVAQEWSSSNKFMWTPTEANPGYQIIVRAQDASNSAESAGVSMPFPIVASSTGNGNGNGKGNGK